MGVKIGQLLSLSSGDLNSLIIPGEYVLVSTGTFSNLPTALANRTVHVRVEYQNYNTTLLSQELKVATTGSQNWFRRTGSQVDGGTLHGSFVFNPWYTVTTSLAT